ncbi:hypothetical protein B1207_02650 [Legionella quinlivanii]|uniref:Uncharacterized protein n=1 Tax=Legionella quinlivanii TaxID=45073 RepID=A0A364LM05_9GAMM|nr:hypothetical protein [Legionella quinlivanii]RAP37907.1 hypothetical protein B1207_02650 [Legionella quinlivanii]
MSKIIIIGAGLGGLYTANRLINEGIHPDNIVLIDRRSGIYTRPGHIKKSTFSKVQEKTGIDTSDHSPACHIKELERFMYTSLQSKGCLFLNETFIGMKPGEASQECGVITVASDGIQHIYPASYVYDCSGKTGIVARAVNEYQQKQNLDKVFVSRPLVDINPIPDHLIAQIIIADPNSIKNFYNLSSANPVPSYYKRHKSAEQSIATREALQDLGWHYDAFPTFYVHSREAKGKVCAYMEAPHDLSDAKQSEWVNLLLGIYSNGRISSYTPLKSPVKYETKPRIEGFTNEIHVLNRATFKSNALPAVLVGFDALKGTDYRSASGVDSGIDCFEIMLKHTKINKGTIETIDFKSIEDEVFMFIDGLYRSDLTVLQQSRQQSIYNGHNYFSHLYESAATKLSSSDSIKKKHYTHIAARLAVQAASARFTAFESRETEDPLTSLEILNKCLKSLIRVQSLLPANETEEYYQNNERIQKVIQSIRLELDLLDLDSLLAGESSHIQRLSRFCKRLKQNFSSLMGNFAFNTIQKKISNMESCINRQPEDLNKVINQQTSLYSSSQLTSDASPYSSTFFQAPDTVFVRESCSSSATLRF